MQSTFPLPCQPPFSFELYVMICRSIVSEGQDTKLSVFCVSLPEIHISLVICVRGYTYHGDTHITVTPVQYLENIGPAIERSDWLILVIGPRTALVV